jgi:hypothetical protein
MTLAQNELGRSLPSGNVLSVASRPFHIAPMVSVRLADRAGRRRLA